LGNAADLLLGQVWGNGQSPHPPDINTPQHPTQHSTAQHGRCLSILGAQLPERNRAILLLHLLHEEEPREVWAAAADASAADACQ
jgi:hypothetical protein